MVVSTLGVLNGRATPISDTLSSTNPSDDFNLTLRSAGSLDLNFGGLSSSTSVVLRSSNAPDKKAQIGSGKVVFTGLDKGDYTVHVEAPLSNETFNYSGTVNGIILDSFLDPTTFATLRSGPSLGSRLGVNYTIDQRVPTQPQVQSFTFSDSFETTTFTPQNSQIQFDFSDTGSIEIKRVIGQVGYRVFFYDNYDFAGNLTGKDLQVNEQNLLDPTNSENALYFGGFLTGSGVTTGNGNSSTPFTLTLTADYAENTTTAAEAIRQIPTPTLANPQTQQTYNNPDIFQDFIGSSDQNDYYKFTINTPIDATHNGSNVYVDLSGLAANATVQLLNSQGTVLATATGSSAKDGSLEHILGTGTYYIDVIPSGADTNYTLKFAETPLTTNLTYAGDGTFTTNLWEFDSSDKGLGARYGVSGIDPTKPTVLIIHGWNPSGSPEYVGDDLATLAQQIASKYTNEQVLALDWGLAAKDSSLIPFYAAGHVMEVATWAVNELKALGIQPNLLTLIGHSLGSYVADEIGVKEGRVENLYALDPAGPIASLYDLDRNTAGIQAPPRFDTAAVNSYAFFSNQIIPTEAEAQAATAKQSFVVVLEGSALQVAQNHGAGILTLTSIVNRGLINSDTATPANNFTYLRSTKTGGRLNPTLNQYDQFGFRFPIRQHEGVVHLKQSGNSWNITKLNYILNGSEVEDWSSIGGNTI